MAPAQIHVLDICALCGGTAGRHKAWCERHPSPKENGHARRQRERAERFGPPGSHRAGSTE